jgi:hypothetical protein
MQKSLLHLLSIIVSLSIGTASLAASDILTDQLKLAFEQAIAHPAEVRIIATIARHGDHPPAIDRAEAARKAKAEADAKAEAARKARAEATAKAAAAAEQAKKDAAAKKAKEAAAKTKADDEKAAALKQQAAEEAKALEKKQAEEKAKKEADDKLKKEAADKAKKEADARAEVAAKAKADAIAKRKRQAEARNIATAKAKAAAEKAEAAQTNNAPTLDTYIPEATVSVGQEYSINLNDYFSDPDGDILIYNAELPSWLTIDGSILSGTPTVEYVGEWNLTIDAQDTSDLISPSSMSKLFIIDPNNNPPTISNVAYQTIAENESTGALAFTVNDPETPAPSLTVIRSSSNTTLIPLTNVVLGGSGANRNVTVTPAPNQIGSATITLTVSDGSLHTIETFMVTVTPVIP